MKINLRHYYPNYTKDVFVEMDDEIAIQMIAWEREEIAIRRKVYRYHAQYSLDRNDGLEVSTLLKNQAPDEALEKKVTQEQLQAAIALLPDVQAKRITAYFFEGMTTVEIAKAEGIGTSSIIKSI